ncbi:MAG: sigma-70 region 2 domain protein [Frankiales bacterium]|jgi:RNA polymerase sigma-70 factor (ECF subfamily)|nr:sigma-70 region 2 domain protein [Frankiales bacterium]
MNRESTSTSERDLMQTLHDEHAAALWAFAVRLTGGDRAAAEDVVQETLFRAWKQPDNPVFAVQESRAARSWLYTVARRIVIDEWRARNVRPEKLVADVPDLSTADHAEQLVESRLIADALARLTVEHRAVLVEMYYKRSTVREAAANLEIAEGTVKSRTHYALRAFKLALAEMGVRS